jgi:hypothetical protein
MRRPGGSASGSLLIAPNTTSVPPGANALAHAVVASPAGRWAGSGGGSAGHSRATAGFVASTAQFPAGGTPCVAAPVAAACMSAFRRGAAAPTRHAVQRQLGPLQPRRLDGLAALVGSGDHCGPQLPQLPLHLPPACGSAALITLRSTPAQRLPRASARPASTSPREGRRSRPGWRSNLSGRSRMRLTVLMPLALASWITSCGGRGGGGQQRPGRVGWVDSSITSGPAPALSTLLLVNRPRQSLASPAAALKPSLPPMRLQAHLAHVACGPALHQRVPLSQLHKLVQQAHRSGGAGGVGGRVGVCGGGHASCNSCPRRLQQR